MTQDEFSKLPPYIQTSILIQQARNSIRMQVEQLDKEIDRIDRQLLWVHRIEAFMLYLSSFVICIFVGYAMRMALEDDSLQSWCPLFSFCFAWIVFSFFVYPAYKKIRSKIRLLKKEMGQRRIARGE